MPRGMVRGAFRTMGTEVTVLVPRAHVAALSDARRLVTTWERALSSVDPDSDLHRLNRRETRTAGPLLADALRAALMAAWWTDGLYDPGVGARPAVPPADRAGGDGAAVPGGAWRGLVLADDGGVRMPPGLRLDLGGIARGLAADAAAAALRREGVPAGMVDLGGALVVWGPGPSRGAWPVTVPEADGASAVPLRRGALATSATGHPRPGRDRGAVRHQVVDPRTGRPAETDLRAVSVAADRCADAEAAATAAQVLGREAGARFLRDRGLHGLLVPRQGPPVPVGAWPVPRTAVAA